MGDEPCLMDGWRRKRSHRILQVVYYFRVHTKSAIMPIQMSCNINHSYILRVVLVIIMEFHWLIGRVL